MERELATEFVRVTEAAAIASAEWIGRGDKNAADRAAVDAMRRMLDTVAIDGEVVIGEGEIDEAPMLYIGEHVGDNNGSVPAVDIAVDPLEGTTITAQGRSDALSVLAVAPRDNFLNAPDMYMEKIAVGPAAKGSIDIEDSLTENLKSVSQAKSKPVEELTVFVLDKPRHTKENGVVERIRDIGGRVKLVEDGDIAGALSTGLDSSDVDMMVGTGGAPEGVLAAAGLKCLRGELQAQLAPQNQSEIDRAEQMGIESIDSPLRMDDLAAGNNVIFSATGVTDGTLLAGVKGKSNKRETESLVMRSNTGTIRFVEAIHDLSQNQMLT